MKNFERTLEQFTVNGSPMKDAKRIVTRLEAYRRANISRTRGNLYSKEFSCGDSLYQIAHRNGLVTAHYISLDGRRDTVYFYANTSS